MTIHSYDPRTGEPVGEALEVTSEAGVDEIVRAAARAGQRWRVRPAAERAEVLEAIGEVLLERQEDLWRIADRETALGETRLQGEIARSAGQFKLFARVIRDGGHTEAVIDHADPSAVPPRPDLRRMNHPLPGVVAVFSASNFPFAFSVAGGDTASALAAGCPVVVKAHSGHPALSALTAEVIRTVLPDPALLGLIQGTQAGAALVRHPGVVAAGFTGSISGGAALQKLIAERDDPIPFYGELGSVNPVVVLPSADREGLAEGFAASLTLGSGQFCTNPGLLFVPDDPELITNIADAVVATKGNAMLTDRIVIGYREGLARLAGLGVLAEGTAGEGPWAATPTVFTTDLKTFADGLPALAEECFGPAAVLVTYDDPAELPAVLERLGGSLTATVHGGEVDEALEVVSVFSRTAGRLIWNGWPTGVAVTWAMHHGGPWPASTTPAHTSVGSFAIRRWLAPTAYQGWPHDLLPLELRDGNPLGVPRRVNGVVEEVPTA